MPFTKNKRYASNAHLTKGNYNPFPELYQTPMYNEKSKSSSKLFKKGRKCFQIVLICQKLLKPFGNSSAGKSTNEKPGKSGSRLEKSRSAHQINVIKNSPQEPHRSQINKKIDASCQTNIDLSYYDGVDYNNNNNNNINNNTKHTNSNTFNTVQIPRQRKPDPFMIQDDLIKKNAASCDLLEYPADDDDTTVDPVITNTTNNGYWDLDIDSAIVGDFNSISEASLTDEHIDPLYSTIKWTTDYPVNVPLSSRPIYDSPDQGRVWCESNTSSPKSGIYSKINKPRRKIFYPPDNNTPIIRGSCDKSKKLNFEHIMRIRSQLGLVVSSNQTLYDNCAATKPAGTRSSQQINLSSSLNGVPPKIPSRNYGESVIDLILQTRKEQQLQFNSMKPPIATSTTSIPQSNTSGSISHNELYSPIWLFNSQYITNSIPTNTITPPSTEPIIPKYHDINSRHQINPMFNEAGSVNSSSCMSFYSPIKKVTQQQPTTTETKINYPAYQIEDESSQFNRNGIMNLMMGDMKHIRHMDSEIELSKYSTTMKENPSKLYDYLKVCDLNNLSSQSYESQVPYEHRLLLSSSLSKLKLTTLPCVRYYQPQVQLDDDNNHDDIDEKQQQQHLLLQPLMERSCEYDDFLNCKNTNPVSLDYINF